MGTKFNWNLSASYNAANKAAFHRQARKQLRKLVLMMGLELGTYDLRVNMAGIAVSGEITLHTDTFYLQVMQSCMGATRSQNGILLRTCKGQTDYHGGRNYFANLDMLDDENLPALAERVRFVVGART